MVKTTLAVLALLAIGFCAGSFNGRTVDSDSANGGSIPSPATKTVSLDRHNAVVKLLAGTIDTQRGTINHQYQDLWDLDIERSKLAIKVAIYEQMTETEVNVTTP